MFFHRNQKRSAKFVQWAFLDLVVVFAAIGVYKPAVGLAGIGAVLILASLIVLANKNYIWEGYKKNYKKSSNALVERLSRPTELARQLNVYVVWPLIFVLGLLAIYAAYYVD
jgi:hypothetical protein